MMILEDQSSWLCLLYVICFIMYYFIDWTLHSHENTRHLEIEDLSYCLALVVFLVTNPCNVRTLDPRQLLYYTFSHPSEAVSTITLNLWLLRINLRREVSWKPSHSTHCVVLLLAYFNWGRKIIVIVHTYIYRVIL